MDKETLRRLSRIATIGLLLAGLIFLCVGLFDGSDGTKPLQLSLGCILLGNLLNLYK